MYFQQKEAIVAFGTTLLVFVLYVAVLLTAFSAQAFQAQVDFRFWAASTLLLIPVTIVIQIIVHIVFIIINQGVLGEAAPKVTDELDVLIERRASKVAYWTFILAFFLSVALLLFNLSPAAMFMGFIAGSFISGLARDLTKIRLYQTGVFHG